MIFINELETKIYLEIDNLKLNFFLPKSGDLTSCPALIISFLIFLVDANTFKSLSPFLSSNSLFKTFKIF